MPRLHEALPGGTRIGWNHAAGPGLIRLAAFLRELTSCHPDTGKCPMPVTYPPTSWEYMKCSATIILTLRHTTDDVISEYVKLTDRSLEEARDLAKQLLDMGNGLYKSVDISVDNAVVETLRPNDKPSE